MRPPMLPEAVQDEAARLPMLDEAIQDEAARPPMLNEAIQDEAANAGRGRQCWRRLNHNGSKP